MQLSGGKIVGFYGKGHASLRLIGAHLEPVSHVHPFTNIGPFGGEDSDCWDDGKFNGLKRIVITWGWVIDSVSFLYDNDGITAAETRHGGTGGSNFGAVELDYPDEYMASMAGYYVEFDGHIVVIGFHGRSSNYLESIGAHFGPVYHLHPLKTLGPFGDDSGHPWNDSWDVGNHSGLRQINIRCATIIDSICCIYDDNGNSVQASTHGGDRGEPNQIILDHPDEYLTSISGYAGKFLDEITIRSLTFQSNKKTHGPFGIREGKHFSFSSNIGKIIGFHGSSSTYLNSIGVHTELLSSNNPSIKLLELE
ncbi:PYK10-binding protein 1-like [Punica granatum]|uniref:PYK10-binding protein 1-like n=1 Tax=Punica granatum TaxID=22663 RepID=A0A6P8CBV6_PUNGR|nr:PYK10-binding protein 1-like [Punica granatum]